jgi:flavorubredoxin
MKPRKIVEGVHWMGAIDWDRRLFDSLIPLPDGTSYNAYLVRGSQKTALLDTVDPSMRHFLEEQLADVHSIDYVISHHTEQDHSGSIPYVLEKYPSAQVVASTKAKQMLMDHLLIPASRITVVQDGETLSLGDKTLKFIYTPWVHWPETMSTYLQEDQILFSCDFFGSHFATTDLYVANETLVEEAAKRYYAEIMMPFRAIIRKNLDTLSQYQIEYIAPSHGPVYNRPQFIMDAYWEWIVAPPKNIVVIPYTSMHDSTRRMVEHLVGALEQRGVKVQQFDLADTDIGKLAISLVDAATLVIGTPTVLAGPHPNTAYAVSLTNALRPKLRYASVIGSYGWGGKTVEKITAAIPNLQAELLPPVLCKGVPKEQDLAALDDLADTIAKKHQELGWSEE